MGAVFEWGRLLKALEAMMDIDSKTLEELTKDLLKRWKTDKDNVTEDDTKVIYIEPVLKCLGWDHKDNMRRGKPDSFSGQKADYILHENDKNYLAVEAKGLKHDLRSKDVARAFKYALSAETQWCLLTEGYFYQVYNIKWDLPSEEKLFFETSLTEAHKNFSRFLYKINLLSKQSMTSGKTDRLGRTFYRRKKIGNLFINPPEELIQAIEKSVGYKELSEAEIKETLKEVSYRRFMLDRCPLCVAVSRRESEIKREEKAFGTFLETIPLPYNSWEELEEHMQKKHPEVFDPLVYLEKDH